MTSVWAYLDSDTKRRSEQLRAQRQRALYDLQIHTQRGELTNVVPITAAKAKRRR